MSDKETIIKNKFLIYQEKYIADNILYKVIPGIIILGLMLLNDLFIINNIASCYTRLPLIILIIIELIIVLFFKEKTKLIALLFTMILAIVPIALYAKILIHSGDEPRIISSTIGTIVGLVVVVIELRTNLIKTLFIFVLPFIILIFAMYYRFDNIEDVHFVLINISPFIILGVFTNYIKNKQTYKLFKTNFLLSKERDKVEELNAEARATNDTLVKLDATKNKFFSIIAHDLKSPFNVILGYSNLLSEDYYLFSDEKRLKYIKEIEDSANNTLDLLNNLLTWARSQQEDIEIKKEKINLYIFVSKVIEKHCNLAKTKAIEINVDIPIDIVLNVDNYTFKTILINLFNNASKFTKPGGEINISAKTINNTIEISVSDSGIGMPKEIKDNIFSIEKNTSTLGTNNEKGTGLGLILCKEFIEKNDGEIKVESEVGKGTRFILTFF